MSKLDYIDKSTLEDFISYGMTKKEIAEKIHCSYSTVGNILGHHGINLSSDMSNIFTKELLESTDLSITELSRLYKCSTDVVWKYLKKYKIGYSKNKKAINKLSNKEWVEQEYITKNRTLSDISTELNCSRPTVKKFLKIHGLQTKPRYEEKVWFVDIPREKLINRPSIEIAKEFNCSEEYVRQTQIRNDVPRLSGWNSSSLERSVHSILENAGISFQTNVRNIIPKNELDIFIPEKNIAIEINGVYFHSSKFLDKNYHENKRLLCEKQGIRLIQVFEDDLDEKFQLIEDILLHALGKSDREKIYARKCSITRDVPINIRRDFLNKNHIQGFAKSTDSVGLVFENYLVALALFDGDVLTRYATSCDVLGGFSRILKNSGKSFVKTFVDYNLFTGGVYEKSGMKLAGYIPPDYTYLFKNKRIHKFNFRKERFLKDKNLIYKEGLTERELADINKLYRIYDSGKGIYEWHDQTQKIL